jgi:uncharacterized protein YdeI (BOF family)
MKDKKVTTCAVLCIIAGLITLSIAAREIEPECVPISSLTQAGCYTACEGIVCAVYRSDGHTFVHIYDGNVLDVPFFNADIDISVGDLLHVEGTVSEYGGRMQIIPRVYTRSTLIYGVSTDSVFYAGSDSCDTVLPDGFHAIVGTCTHGKIHSERELSYSFIHFSGLITSCHSQKDSYHLTLFGDLHLHHNTRLGMGQVTGYGIPYNNSVVILWYQWKDLEYEPISSAKTHPDGYPVKICGTITSVQTSNGHIFISIEDWSGTISVPIFRDQQEALNVHADNLAPGQVITITGIVSHYKGELEILPSVIS